MQYLNKINYFLLFYIILFNLTMVSKGTDTLEEDNRRLLFASKVLSEEIVDKINQRGYLDPLFQYKRSCDFRPSLKIHLNNDKLREDLVNFYTKSENVKTLWDMSASIKPNNKILDKDNPFHVKILKGLHKFKKKALNPGRLLIEGDLIFSEPSPEARRRITNPELSKAMWRLPELKQIFRAQDDDEA